MASDFTIVIPTYNRPQWLEKTLPFLESQGLTSHVLVLDGSSDENHNKNQLVCKDFKNLGVDLKKYDSALSLIDRVKSGLKEVKTEFVILWPDDDYLILAEVQKHADFLKQNKEFSAALGKTLVVSMFQKLHKISRNHGVVLFDELKFAPSVVDAAPIRRIISYFLLTRMGSMPLFYSVRRTAQLTTDYNTIPGHFKYSTMEFLLNSLTLIRGKIKVFPDLYSYRNYSSIPTNCAQRDVPGAYFSDEELVYSKRKISELLATEQGLEKSLAEKLVDQIIEVPYDAGNFTAPDTLKSEYNNVTRWKKIRFTFWDIFNYDYPKKNYDTNATLFKQVKKFI